jgi:nicotinate-nucleotide adenylyltransferase
MVAAAVGPEDGLVACDLELRRGGPSYTIDTLEELAARPDHPELFLVLGSDAAAGLDTWERAEGIDRLCTIVVVDRPGARTEVPPGFAVQHLEVPRLEVSSTDLRERVRTGRSLRHLVPDPVISLIRERGLYGGGDDPRPAGQVGSPGRAARP